MYSTTYSRRNILKLGMGSLLGASTLGLAACDTTVPSNRVQGPVAMRLFYWGAATRDKLTKQATALFHKHYPDVTITSYPYTDFTTFWGRLDKLVASGNTPDLFQMDMRYLSKYIRSDLMLDLSQLIYNQTIDLSDFDPLMLDNSKANNSIYGIPMGGNYQCLVYDTALFDQADVGVLPARMSWETLGEYLAAIANSLKNGIYGSGDSSGDLSVYEIWIRQRGKDLYTPDGRLAFDIQDVEDWFNYWAQLRVTGGCAPADIAAAFGVLGGPVNSPLIHGKSVFAMPHTNEFESYQALTQHKLTMHALPDGPGPGLYYKPSLLLSISAKTPDVQEAAHFVDFLFNNPDGIKAIGIDRGVPGSLKAQTLLRPNLTPVQQTVINFSNALSQSGNTRVKDVLDPPNASQVANIFAQVALQVAAKHTSITAGATSFYTAAQKALG